MREALEGVGSLLGAFNAMTPLGVAALALIVALAAIATLSAMAVLLYRYLKGKS